MYFSIIIFRFNPGPKNNLDSYDYEDDEDDDELYELKEPTG